MPFTEEWLTSGHSTIQAQLVECCRTGCPSGSFSSLHRAILKLCQSDHWVLGHLPDSLTPIAQIGRAASSRESHGGSKLLPFTMEATVLMGIFNAAAIFLQSSPDLNTILTQGFTDNSLDFVSWFVL